MDLGEVGELLEGLCVPEWYVDDAVVGQGTHGSQGGALLSSTKASSRDKQASVLAVERTLLPELAGRVPKGLPLSREVAVTGGNAEQEGVIGLEDVGRDEGDRLVLAWGVHLAEDLLRQSLLHLIEVCLATSSLNALLLGLGDLGNVPVHGVLQGSESASHCITRYVAL